MPTARSDGRRASPRTGVDRDRYRLDMPTGGRRTFPAAFAPISKSKDRVRHDRSALREKAPASRIDRGSRGRGLGDGSHSRNRVRAKCRRYHYRNGNRAGSPRVVRDRADLRRTDGASSPSHRAADVRRHQRPCFYRRIRPPAERRCRPMVRPRDHATGLATTSVAMRDVTGKQPSRKRARFNRTKNNGTRLFTERRSVFSEAPHFRSAAALWCRSQRKNWRVTIVRASNCRDPDSGRRLRLYRWCRRTDRK